MPKYTLVEEAARHCWSNNFLEVFREFFNDNAEMFKDAPLTPSEEQDLEFYALFQRYLRLYENTLSDYIESLDCTVEEFYQQLADIKNDPTITDKKLLHFTNYLIACTDYPSFYKVMVRAAKKPAKAESKGESKSSEAKSSRGEDKEESKADHK